MLQCLTGLSSRRHEKKEKEKREKKKTSDDVACFCFLSERACGVETGRSCMYVCRVPVRWGIYFFNCLWSLPGFEVTLSEWGKKPSRSHRKFTLQLGLAKNCNLHNLFFKQLKCKEMRRSLGAQQTRPSAWQPQLNTLPLHICSQLQLEERQHESF